MFLYNTIRTGLVPRPPVFNFRDNHCVFAYGFHIKWLSSRSNYIIYHKDSITNGNDPQRHPPTCFPKTGRGQGIRRLREQSIRSGCGRNAFRGEHPFASFRPRHEPTSKRSLYKYNEALHELGRGLNIGPLTSYVARHSWATEAYRRHTPIAIISQALGHTSERTTRFYLDQLDVSDLAKANRLIVGDLDRMVGRP